MRPFPPSTPYDPAPEGTAGPGRPEAGGLVRRIGRAVLGPIRSRLRRRAGERMLMELDDRLLRDVGLKRADLQASVYGPWRFRSRWTGPGAARRDHQEARATPPPALRRTTIPGGDFQTASRVKAGRPTEK